LNVRRTKDASLRRSPVKTLLSAALAIFCCHAFGLAAARAIPPASEVVMFGDSTTAERPGLVEKVYAVRVKAALNSLGLSAVVRNAGVISNTTAHALARLEKDVLSSQPRLVVIQFGLNDAAIDVWKAPPATTSRVSLGTYEANLRTIILAVRRGGAKAVLMTPNPARWTPALKTRYGKPPYRAEDPEGLDQPILTSYCVAVRKLAAELSVPLVDVHEAFLSRGPDRLLLDGMHPNDLGHQLIAELLAPVIHDQLR